METDTPVVWNLLDLIEESAYQLVKYRDYLEFESRPPDTEDVNKLIKQIEEAYEKYRVK